MYLFRLQLKVFNVLSYRLLCDSTLQFSVKRRYIGHKSPDPPSSVNIAQMSKCRSRFSCRQIRRARKRKGERWKFNNTLWLVIDTGKRSAKNFGKMSDGKRVLTAGKKKPRQLPAMNLPPYLSSDLRALAFSSLGPSFSLARILSSRSTARHLLCRCDHPPFFHPSSFPLLSSLADTAGDEGSRVWILRIDKVPQILLRQKEGLSIFHPPQISSCRFARSSRLSRTSNLTDTRTLLSFFLLWNSDVWWKFILIRILRSNDLISFYDFSILLFLSACFFSCKIYQNAFIEYIYAFKFIRISVFYWLISIIREYFRYNPYNTIVINCNHNN